VPAAERLPWPTNTSSSTASTVPLFFAVAQRFLEEFASVSDTQVVILRLTDVKGLDASAAQALGDIVDHLERRGITVLLKGVRPEHFRTLEAVDLARLHVVRTGSAGPTDTTGTA
jgi:SulP family sulfate permease